MKCKLLDEGIGDTKVLVWAITPAMGEFRLCLKTYWGRVGPEVGLMPGRLAVVLGEAKERLRLAASRLRFPYRSQ